MRTILFAALMALATTPVAARQPSSDRAPQDPNKVICETEQETGSRLASHKTCLTGSQWEDLRREQRQTVDKIQAFKPRNGG